MATPQKSRRQRTRWACDECRARRVRCTFRFRFSCRKNGTKLASGNERDEKRCARCFRYNIHCTGRTELLRKPAQVEALQKKLGRLEATLRRISATDDDSNVNPMHTSRAVKTSQDTNPKSRKDINVLDNLVTRGSSLAETSGLLHMLGPNFGPSSELAFLKKALDFRRSIGRGSETFIMTSDEPLLLYHESGHFEDASLPYSFPESDLLFTLIDLFFQHINAYFPVLHRPTFDAGVSKGLHLRNRHFAEVVLLVAAAGSRYSTDHRVLLNEEGRDYVGDDETNFHSSGWKWFTQVQVLPTSFSPVLNLYELQKICLASHCMYSACALDQVWCLVGVGLRFAQEAGLHRRKRPGHVWTIQDELQKRAFWVMLCLDRFSSSILGRPCSLHDEDIDVELPAICDDEHWEHADPQKAFKQPKDKPSKMAFFIAFIHLTSIMTFTSHTIYAVRKFRARVAKGNPHWEENALRSIDSALNRWHDTVPDFLRWPHTKANSPFYHQSSLLYLLYHYLQIQAHKPFISSLNTRSRILLPNLEICANAARLCGHIFATLGKSPIMRRIQPFFAPIAGNVIIILLLRIWEVNKSGVTVDLNGELQGIRHCMEYLKALQTRFSNVTPFVNLFQYLISQDDSSIPDVSLSIEHTFDSSLVEINALSSVQAEDVLHPQNQSTVNTASPGLPSIISPLADDSMNDLRAPGYDLNASWDNMDVDMLHDLVADDEFYRNLLLSFNVPMPDTHSDIIPNCG